MNQDANGRAQVAAAHRWLRTPLEFWHVCAKRLHENNLIALSAALSFRTIFALIPVLILVFLMLRSMGVVEDGKRALRDFLHTSGLTNIAVPIGGDEAPATQALERDDTISVAAQIEDLVGHVESQLTFQRIGPVGALLMIWTALTLLITLEEALNRIFGAPRNRSAARRILLFWSALTLGPMLIVAVNYFGHAAAEGVAPIPGLSSLAVLFGLIAPILVAVLVVAMMYKLIPNTRVPFQSAFIGAVLTVPVWMVARWGFAIYVEQFVLKGNLYGVLGALPLFLLWLNVSWTIFLFGAEIAHTLTNFRRLRSAQIADEQFLGASDWLSVAVAIARPFRDGVGPARLDEIAAAAELPAASVQRIAERMQQAAMIGVVADGDDETTDAGERRYVWLRPAERVPVSDILRLADPRAEEPDATPAGTPRRVAAEYQRAAQSALGEQSLAELLGRNGRTADSSLMQTM